MKNKNKHPPVYIHDVAVHNSNAPNEIIPILIELFKPISVVDFGCGIGTFLSAFKSFGVTNVLGIDGPWASKELLYTNINPSEFLETNLAKDIQLPVYYDMVLSLEVAEHIEEKYANVFIRNLIAAGKIIVFSAAVPQQGGQNHVNEQWQSYWSEKFNQQGYVVHDILKPYLWNNPNVFFWYKQNMVVATPKDFMFQKEFIHNTLEDVIHKDMFQFRLNQLDAEISLFRSGKLPFSSYVKYLLTSIFSAK
jgi:SAM-dependent methyltransferase